jgi:hypothetical protein
MPGLDPGIIVLRKQDGLPDHLAQSRASRFGPAMTAKEQAGNNIQSIRSQNHGCQGR